MAPPGELVLERKWVWLPPKLTDACPSPKWERTFHSVVLGYVTICPAVLQPARKHCLVPWRMAWPFAFVTHTQDSL